MKNALIIALILGALCLVTPLRAQLTVVPDKPPVFWMENTNDNSGTDFVSLVFRTIPGVAYMIQTSEDLTAWETLDGDYYGLGQEIAVPMFEIPHSSSSGGGNVGPPDTGAPSFCISLVMRPAVGGGILLSWRSLDSGVAIQHHLPELSAATEWMAVPLYANEFSEYSFMISHPGVLQNLPSTPLPLGPLDQAMIDVFEENFPAMNAEVTDSVARSRNSVAHPAPPQGTNKFWRVAPKWDLDSDSDGTEDWLEFNYIATNPGQGTTYSTGNSGGSSTAYSDPFSSDTNNNGIPDGDELDSDKDDVLDSTDADKSEIRINWSKNGPMRFAWFHVDPPTEGSPIPKQVNDQGKVLFEQSIWHNGQILDLPVNGPTVSECSPLAMGDSGTIIGRGRIDLPGDPSTTTFPCMVAWSTPEAAPVVLKNGDNYPCETYEAAHGFGTDMILTTDNKFIGIIYEKFVSYYSYDDPVYVLRIVDPPSLKVWQIQPSQAGSTGISGAISQISQAPDFAEWVDSSGKFWGLSGPTSSSFTTGGINGTPYQFEKNYSRSVYLPHGVPAVFKGYQSANPLAYEAGDISAPQFYLEAKNTWIECDKSTFDNSVDFSTEGRFSICRYFSIWHNGKKDNASEWSPGLSADWNDRNKNQLLDTTSHGWTLAVKKDENLPPSLSQVMVGLPLFFETATPSEGLDLFSMTVNKSFEKPAALKGLTKEFWIMVPAGGEIPVRLKSGACPATPLTIGGGSGKAVAVSPDSISENDGVLTFSAPLGAAGTEEDVSVKLGTVDSLSIPLKAKIMKPRLVAVSVWPIANGVNGVAPAIPTEQEFENYLNGLYQKQLNVTFNVTIQTTPGANSDTDNNGRFDVTDPPNPVQVAISSTRKAGDIKVYVMGGRTLLWPEGNGMLPLGGLANPDEAFVWKTVDNATGVDAAHHEEWLNVVAHEIGHVFFGEGHPNTSSGPAPLPGTNQMIRLMHNGLGHVGSGLICRVCVKAEWDKAERWLIDHIDNKVPQ